MALKTTKKKRARTTSGHFKKDDPSTPQNEAWETVVETGVKASSSGVDVWYESREPEPSMFPVAGYHPIRNFSRGTLEWRVRADDTDRFEANHFFQMARVVKKREE